MLCKKVVFVAALLTSVAVQADTAPSYRYVQGSVEHISQSGEETLSDTGFGAKAAWQFNNNWFIAADWQRFSDSESYAENFNNQQLVVSLDLTLDRYYLGGGYIMPVSEATNLSFAGYLGSYRLGAKGRLQVFTNGQPTAVESYSESDSSESLKIETVLRSNVNSKLELSGRAYYEYLNANLDDKSQYGVGVGAQYNFSSNFALTTDLSYSKVLDENTSQFGVGARYQF